MREPNSTAAGEGRHLPGPLEAILQEEAARLEAREHGSMSGTEKLTGVEELDRKTRVADLQRAIRAVRPQGTPGQP